MINLHPMLTSLFTDRFRKWLLGQALKLLDYDWHKAEDAVQTVYCRLLRTKRFDPERGSPTTFAMWWLRSVISQERRRSARQMRRRTMVNQYDLSRRPDEPDYVEIRDELSRVRSAIQDLPGKQKDALSRFELDETQEQFGRRRGVCRQAVDQMEKKAIHRVRASLGCL